MTNRPILAATMGDPAGIGPEICVRALLDPEVRGLSRSFVIGDSPDSGESAGGVRSDRDIASDQRAR